MTERNGDTIFGLSLSLSRAIKLESHTSFDQGNMAFIKRENS